MTIIALVVLGEERIFTKNTNLIIVAVTGSENS